MRRIIEVNCSEEGSNARSYQEGRSCRKCRNKLSRYNPNAYCYSCTKKLTSEEINTPHRRLYKRSPQNVLEAQYVSCKNLWDSTLSLTQNAKKIKTSANRAWFLAKKFKLTYKRGTNAGQPT